MNLKNVMKNRLIDKRYKIVKKCGVGATGDVYKVRDIKSNKIVAIKLLSKKATSSRIVQRFKREFRLLTDLHHPNLCSVYDFGILSDGRSYFTMEYIDGENIFEFTKELPYRRIYPLVVQLCRALEYIHTKGLIHYDMKPGNVLVQVADGEPVVKLMDFGLAGEQQVEGGVMIRGTFPYIAPEVIKGLAIDHRADLYSVGILMYEVFVRSALPQTHTVRFTTLLQEGKGQFSTLRLKIDTDIPKWLERLMLRLCSIEPAVRFTRANEVIREINKFSRSKFALETEETIEGYLLSSTFVGREHEMDLLVSCYEAIKQGKGRIVLITGEAGIGKSRLLKEFKIVTQMKRSHTFTGYVHKDRIKPLEPFFDIFNELFNHIKDKRELFRSKKLKLSLAVLLKMFPELANYRLRRKLPRLVPLEPHAEKMRTLEALSELVRFASAHLGGIVILLEDLHWADDLSIQFLEYLGRNLGSSNILICATCRKEELEENRTLKRMMSNVKNERHIFQLELKPFNSRSLSSFLNSTITSKSNSSELVRYLMKKTGGNPYFVEEIMRTLLREKKVPIGERIELKHFSSLTIPGTLQDLILQRLDGLDDCSLIVAKYASLFLKDFTYAVLKQLTDLEDTELSRALWQLKRKQILIEEHNTYRLYHTVLREAINNSLDPRERKTLYYGIGKTLESNNRKKYIEIVEDLAYYFINAGYRKKGIQYGIQAAQKSTGRYAYEQAVQFYRGVLSLLGGKDVKHRFSLLQDLAQAEMNIDHYGDALQCYKHALHLGRGNIEQRVRIYFGIASVHVKQGQYSKALQSYQRAGNILKKMNTSMLKTLLQSFIDATTLNLYLQIGIYKQTLSPSAKTLLRLKYLRGLEATKLLIAIYSNLGAAEIYRLSYGKVDYAKSISYYKKAYEYSMRLKDKYRIATILANIGICYHCTFCYQQAIAYYTRSLRLSEEVGDQHGISMKLLNLGITLRDQGNYSKAQDCFHRALAVATKIGNPAMMSGAHLGIGAYLLETCSYRDAQEHFTAALKGFDAIHWQAEKGFLIKGMGSIQRALGDYPSAFRYYREALRVFRENKQHRKIASVLSNMSSTLLECGEIQKAKKYIMDALKITKDNDSTDDEIECDITLCHMYILLKNYGEAFDYYREGLRTAKKLGTKRSIVRLLLLGVEIYYHEQKYKRALEASKKAIKIARRMGTRELYVEALLSYVKNNVTLPKKELKNMIEEAIKIAEEIGCPEVLWRVYFTYGRFYQEHKQNLKALNYYQQSIEIFKDVTSRLQNESQKQRYLNHPDRQAVIVAVREI
jgi:serine/threonine protein kinase/tetratricopeptide (TPR) repeat protein